jgi:hypothetical protein
MYLHYEKLVQQAEYVVVGKVDVEFGVSQHEHFLILLQGVVDGQGHVQQVGDV